ncbi:MAG: response regulator transcription factor [Chloroflexi bacterium]|nr:MAG: response regulator transcription factor [Chloroflexota bacterium]
MKVTRRQAEILELIGSGLSDKEVGHKLGVSQSTIRTHLKRLYRQHGVHSRAEAVVEWFAEKDR